MLILTLASTLITLICSDFDTEKTITVKHYYDLGCRPVVGVNGRIERFICPDFESLDRSKCHFHGKVYDQEESLEENYIGFCEGACFCGGYDESTNTPSTWFCMRHYCEDEEYRNCINQHSGPNSCCAENILCDLDNEKLEELHKCYFNNKTYYEGQFIYPSNQCDSYRCVCDKNFNESIDPSLNSQCVITDKCDLELRHLDSFQMGCAPVYFGEKPKCPAFRCPKKDDRIIPRDPNSEDNGEDVCKFGQLTLKKGDKLDDSCYNCTCIVPPMLFCRQLNENYCP